jgi:hypothetical protein
MTAQDRHCSVMTSSLNPKTAIADDLSRLSRHTDRRKKNMYYVLTPRHTITSDVCALILQHAISVVDAKMGMDYLLDLERK